MTSINYLNVLCELKVVVFKNAVRIFCDACFLYKKRSYASALALTILSLEEIGKYEMTEHLYGDAVCNPDCDPKEFFDSLFIHGMFRDHKNKQVWACGDPWTNLNRNRLERMAKGEFDKKKQNTLYVGYHKGKIIKPNSLTAKDAYREIALIHKTIVEIGRRPFNDDYGEWLNSRSPSQYRYYNSKATKAFARIKKKA